MNKNVYVTVINEINQSVNLLTNNLWMFNQGTETIYGWNILHTQVTENESDHLGVCSTVRYPF